MKNSRKPLTCKKCGWQWFPRSVDALPDICPHCKSKFWNVGRQREANSIAPLRVTDSQEHGELGELQVAVHFKEAVQWQPRSLKPDLGEDLLVDIYENGRSAGFSFYCQIKSSADLEKYRLKNGDFSYPIESKDLIHWTDSFPPVVLLLWDVKLRSGYWVAIPEALRTLDALSPQWKKLRVVKVRVPQRNTTSAPDLLRLRAIIGHQLLPAFSAGKTLTATLKFSFPRDEEGLAQESAVQRFMQLGEGVTIKGKYLEGITVSPWHARKFGEPIIDRSGQITLGPRYSDRIENFRLTLLSSEKRVAQVENIQVKAVRVGEQQITFTNEHLPTPFAFRFVWGQDSQVSITVSLKGSITTAGEGVRAFDFFDSANEGGFLRVEVLTHPEKWGALRRFELPIDKENFPAVDKVYRQLLEQLREIEEKTGVFFKLRDEGITDEDKKTVWEIAEILNIGKRKSHFKQHVITLSGPKSPEGGNVLVRSLLDSWQKGEPIDIKSETQETFIEVLGTKVPLGVLRTHIKAHLDRQSAKDLEELSRSDTFLNSLQFVLIDGEHEEEFLEWMNEPPSLPPVSEMTEKARDELK